MPALAQRIVDQVTTRYGAAEGVQTTAAFAERGILP
jgi:hypothetical protein